MILHISKVFIFFIYCMVGYLLLIVPGLCQEEPGETAFDLGVFAFEDKDFDSAERHLLKALSLAPDQPFYCLFLGKVYLAINQLDKAEKFLTKAFQLNPIMNGLNYDLAYLTFKQSRFSDAADRFSKIVENDPLTQNVLACYYAGISFFECNQYEKAIQYLMRAAERSPTIKPNSMFYCGICYYKQHQTQKAVQHFEYVLMHAPADELKDHAKKWLIALRAQKSQEQPFDCLVKLSVQADDNVMIVSPDWITGDESDGVMQFYLAGKYFFTPKDRHRLGVGFRHYQTVHQDLSEFDLMGNIIDIAYSFQMPLITLGLKYSPSAYRLDGRQYITRHQWKGHVLWNVSDNLMNRFAYSCYIQNHDENSERDGHTHDISMDMYYRLKKHKMKLLAGFSAEENHRNEMRYQYEDLKFTLGLTKKLLYTLTFHSKLGISHRRHEQWDELGFKRKDNKFEFSCTILKPVWQKGMEIGFDYSYTKNNSILDAYDYRRNIFGISFLYHY
ncbi:MAG: DUF560 domain-containing protein [Candidatus Magnetomorum sp.]|nr:DUF560 domain-containing protein [Candidatus Magnetomorum sp.]